METIQPQLLAQSIGDYIREFNLSRKTSNLTVGVNHIQEKIAGQWIIQTDAGCFEDGIVSLGCVIREPDGAIYLAASRNFPSHEDSESAELKGIQWGMELAKALKIEEVMFCSDAMNIVDCVNGTNVNAALDPFVKDCSNVLDSFRNASLLFLSRTFNTDAHHMVRIGKVVGNRTWIGRLPDAVELDVCLASSA